MARPLERRGVGLAVPPAGPGVCATCHGPARDGRRVCWCCRAVSSVLGHQPGSGPLVVPMALFRTGDVLHAVLRGYKDAPAVAARRHFSRGVAVHLSSFLGVHGGCITAAAGSDWDSVAVVPSSARTPGAGRPPSLPARHPLGEVIGAIPEVSALERIEIRRGAGVADHLAPDPGAFEVDAGARGRRVLLVDDTWVTGSRIRSAAAALERGGAGVVAMVTAGRAVGAVDSNAVDSNTANTDAADSNMVPALERWWRWAEARGRGVGSVARGRCCLADCIGERAG